MDKLEWSTPKFAKNGKLCAMASITNNKPIFTMYSDNKEAMRADGFSMYKGTLQWYLSYFDNENKDEKKYKEAFDAKITKWNAKYPDAVKKAKDDENKKQKIYKNTPIKNK